MKWEIAVDNSEFIYGKTTRGPTAKKSEEHEMPKYMKTNCDKNLRLLISLRSK